MSCSGCAYCGEIAYEPDLCMGHEDHSCPSRTFSRTTAAVYFGRHLTLLRGGARIEPAHWERAAQLFLDDDTLTGEQLASIVWAEGLKAPVE